MTEHTHGGKGTKSISMGADCLRPETFLNFPESYEVPGSAISVFLENRQR